MQFTLYTTRRAYTFFRLKQSREVLPSRCVAKSLFGSGEWQVNEVANRLSQNHGGSLTTKLQCGAAVVHPLLWIEG